MKILVTGGTGQIGYELQCSLQPLGEIIVVSRDQMNLEDLGQVREVIQQIRPRLIINPAAYTDVDAAENEPALAMRINGEAPGVMAEEAKKLGAAMIHYSTGYVFNGEKTTPYTEDDGTCPVNVYGKTKLAGERAIQATGIPHLILRTSWVYGMRGKNFLLTVMRLAQEHDILRIVNDQRGTPTWCRTIAEVTSAIVAQSVARNNRDDWWRERSGVYHLTARGEATWYEFAQAIFNHSAILEKPEIIPIATEEYPLTAKRPVNSILSCDLLMNTFCRLPDWRHALQICQQGYSVMPCSQE